MARKSKPKSQLVKDTAIQSSLDTSNSSEVGNEEVGKLDDFIKKVGRVITGKEENADDLSDNNPHKMSTDMNDTKAKAETEAKAKVEAEAEARAKAAAEAKAKAEAEAEAAAQKAQEERAALKEKRTEPAEGTHISFEMIRIKMMKRIKEGAYTRESMTELLAKYGAKSLSNVKESDFAQLYYDLN